METWRRTTHMSPVLYAVDWNICKWHKHKIIIIIIIINVAYLLKARTVKPTETAVARKRLCKQAIY
jgi:hypothetical protein